jgi:Leucine-rich repeat (LRR) protein
MKRLDAQEKKKVICVSIACGILFPIIGGIIALYVSSYIFKNRHIHQITEDRLRQVVEPIVSPGIPITVSPHCTELLDCFGLRSGTLNTFDSNKLSTLATTLLQHTPNHVLDIAEKQEIMSSPGKLEAFLQRVNDYNLSLTFPITWNENPPSDPKEKLHKEVSFIKQELLQEGSALRQQKTLIVSKQATCIPQEVFQCTQLESLFVTSETLCGVSSKLGSLTNLMELNISSSKILSEIPREIGSLSKLTALILGGHPQLKNLPEEMKNLSMLQTLSLIQSGITSLPESFAQLPSLKILLCHDCKNLVVPPELEKKLSTKLGPYFQAFSVLENL